MKQTNIPITGLHALIEIVKATPVVIGEEWAKLPEAVAMAAVAVAVETAVAAKFAPDSMGESRAIC